MWTIPLLLQNKESIEQLWCDDSNLSFFVADSGNSEDSFGSLEGKYLKVLHLLWWCRQWNGSQLDQKSPTLTGNMPNDFRGQIGGQELRHTTWTRLSYFEVGDYVVHRLVTNRQSCRQIINANANDNDPRSSSFRQLKFSSGAHFPKYRRRLTFGLPWTPDCN